MYVCICIYPSATKVPNIWSLIDLLLLTIESSNLAKTTTKIVYNLGQNEEDNAKSESGYCFSFLWSTIAIFLS